MTRVTREDARQALVRALQPALTGVRVQYPNMPKVDISVDKTPYVTVHLIYIDGEATGIGSTANQRYSGSIVVQVHFKKHDPTTATTVNNLLDGIQSVISNTDIHKPLRTYGTKPKSGESEEEGWAVEGLVTPFWYDTSMRA